MWWPGDLLFLWTRVAHLPCGFVVSYLLTPHDMVLSLVGWSGGGCKTIHWPSSCTSWKGPKAKKNWGGPALRKWTLFNYCGKILKSTCFCMFSGFLNIWQVMLMDMSARYCAFGKLVGQFFLFLVSSVASGCLHLSMTHSNVFLFWWCLFQRTMHSWNWCCSGCKFWTASNFKSPKGLENKITVCM